MSERPFPVSDEERARQREVLDTLVRHSRLKLTPIAARVGVSASQMSRYISGETILPTPYYRTVADAFGISVSELTRRLGLVVAEPAGLRAELTAVLGADEGSALEDAILQLSQKTPRRRAEAIARIRALIQADNE